MQNEDVLKTAIENSATWEEAVHDFIDASQNLNQSYTSGHITTILRVYRPEFRFAHARIGEICQDRFFNGEVEYDGAPAVMVSRVCAGLGRTPAGTVVFCVGPDQDAAESFPFELDIPKPGSGLTQMPKEHPIKQTVHIKATIPNKVDMRAKVHVDHRLCVPRVAFEALMAATGKTITAGDKAWVRFDDVEDKAYVSLSQSGSAVDYDISKDRGRILISKPGAGRFNHGDIFAVEVKGDELVIDISLAL